MGNELKMLRLMNLNQNFVFPLLRNSQYSEVCCSVKVTLRIKSGSSVIRIANDAS